MELLYRLIQKGNRLPLIALVMGLLVLGLAACDSGTPTPGTSTTVDTPTPGASTGSGQNDLTPTASTSGGAATEQSVVLSEWNVNVGSTELAAGKYTFSVANKGQFGHDLVILDSSSTEVGRTPVFTKADGSKPLQVDLKAGTYKFYCDVPGHEAQGMKAEVTVK